MENTTTKIVKVAMPGSRTRELRGQVSLTRYGTGARTVNRLVKDLSDSDGIESFVVLLHQGGQQNPGVAQIVRCGPVDAVSDPCDRSTAEGLSG